MKIDIRKEIAAVTDEMIALRRDIHAHPELGFHEYRTGQLVADRLSELGLAVRRCAETGEERRPAGERRQKRRSPRRKPEDREPWTRA